MEKIKPITLKNSSIKVDTTGTAVDCCKAIHIYLCNGRMAEQERTN